MCILACSYYIEKDKFELNSGLFDTSGDMKKLFYKISTFTNKVTSNPWYNLVVSISLIVVSIYDSWKVILADIINFSVHKDHWVLFVGLFMLIHAISNLIKGFTNAEKTIEKVESERLKTYEESFSKLADKKVEKSKPLS